MQVQKKQHKPSLVKTAAHNQLTIKPTDRAEIEIDKIEIKKEKEKEQIKKEPKKEERNEERKEEKKEKDRSCLSSLFFCFAKVK